MWGTPLVVLLVGGGLFFLIYSRFIPYRYFFHSINILRGKYDDPNDPGDISHFEALASALAATVGLGNISGVAVAIAIGGPGAVFWMWISAIVGMATKFFTCTLSIMYRGKDTNGDIQGGTMYMIMEGLGKKWKPLAVLFAVAGLFGPLPIFQANQVTQIVRDFVLIPNGLADAANHFNTDLISGIVILSIVSLVIFGGIKRVGKVASKMVPAMVVIYVACVLVIIGINIDMLGSTFALIFTDAFTANSAMGGALGALIVTGVRRAAFSNEAGIGTATLAHGAAKTKEPVREGLVAMMGPFIDTLVVCTMTALAILVTGVWTSGDENGITLTASAFEAALGPYGVYLLIFCVLIFGFSSLFTYSYYSTKCLGFLIGADKQKYFNFFYAAAIIFGSVATIQAVLNFTDGMFALMAIPTMTVALLLSPKVMAAAKDYFGRMEKKEIL
ncbi:MAG: alanine:cation symporter family protein [Balneola sp.]|nr:alanine:cation symporter family protein [Balneola sp.]MBO6649758.1 alanine:cation symporter family protein [Balneola sp.]MBO6712321.1 alanine:cation symporter family protein [Balneola sp.]MBO6800515.1 alanine:cation symporter family protein [Balneola sp.]MBO6871469.1 alanine:cation symporter family protein [Balneola sp.]